MRCDSLLINVKCTWIEVDEIWCVFVDLGMCVLVARSLTVCVIEVRLCGYYTFVMCSKHGYIHLFIKTYSYGIEI